MYTLGATIYHLLSRHARHAEACRCLREAHRAQSSDQTADRFAEFAAVVQHAEPEPVEQAAIDVPPELAAIVERAMALDPDGRYRDMKSLADDLRAYLEGRVVRAFETGTWAETRKWVARNKGIAASLMIASATLLIGVITSMALARDARSESKRADALAERMGRERNALLSARVIQQLRAEAEELWPARPELITVYERWLEDLQRVVEGSPSEFDVSLTNRDGLAEFRAQLVAASTTLPTTGTITPSAIHGVTLVSEAGIPDSRAGAHSRAGSRTLSENGVWWRDTLQDLVASIESISAPHEGLAGNTLAAPFGWGISRRLQYARAILNRSVNGKDAQRRWSAAIESAHRSPLYRGVEIAPQVGLLPLGLDGDSGLLEFADLQSGEPPVRGADGRWIVTGATCIVFVLLPGSSFCMGAQHTDPLGPNYSADAGDDEYPPHEVSVSPFFMSKYEMTQGQWGRIAATNPSLNGDSYPVFDSRPDDRHPVESVSWTEAAEMMRRLGFELPTEAQWEFAARAGTETPWSTGASKESLTGFVNIVDATARAARVNWVQSDEWPEFYDGSYLHSPVGSFEPNQFGLHDMHGNVFEWCQDGYDFSYYWNSEVTDPVAPMNRFGAVVQRGGSFYNAPRIARSAYRLDAQPYQAAFNCGLRPIRRLTTATDVAGSGARR